MDQGLKERLIGAAVLVILGIWIIPWVLDGPHDNGQRANASLQLPVPPGRAVRVKTRVIDLDSPKVPPSPSVAYDTSSATEHDSATAAPPGEKQVDQAKVDVTDPDAEVSGPGTPSADVPSSEAPTDADDGGSGSDDPPTVQTDNDAQTGTAAPEAPTSSAVSARHIGFPAITADGEWAVQLGSFGDKENAERLAQRITAYGASPEISSHKVDRRLMYRVRIGPYATRSTAESAASLVGANGFVAQVVVNEN